MSCPSERSPSQLSLPCSPVGAPAPPSRVRSLTRPASGNGCSALARPVQQWYSCTVSATEPDRLRSPRSLIGCPPAGGYAATTVLVPGTARTPNTSAAAPGKLDAELDSVVHQADPGQPVVLVGYSFGSYPVLYYTARHRAVADAITALT